MNNCFEIFDFDECLELGYYVYRLVDPRNDETFYVGKGKDNRVFAHVKQFLKNATCDECDSSEVFTAKINRIKDIMDNGYSVKHIIHRRGLDEKTAFEVEASLIDAYPNLTNIQGGHHSERGPIEASELKKEISRTVYEEPDFTYLLVKVNKEVYENNNEDAYESGRKSWKLNERKLKNCKYFFVAVEGIVKGVYTLDNWVCSDKRKQLIGKEADEEIRNLFVDKKIPSYYITKESGAAIQFPTLYSKK